MKKRMSGYIALLIISSLPLVGCMNTTNGTANSNTAPPIVPAEKAQPAPAANQMKATMFTLPVLKAFLANETFKADLKQRLQLTDEQVRQLEAAVQKPEVGASQQSPPQPDAGGVTSAHDARARASERVNAIIGAEKTGQLAALVEEYWRGGASASAAGGAPNTANAPMPTAPNSVPGDTRVVVNAPAYRMDVFRGGELVQSYKVGIGYPEFPLPVGMRQAKEIIFNPTWTPPDEPWVESSNKIKPGETVEAGSKLNPLGIAKIPIGLPSLIHGGKRAAQIGGFASHGCVGLTDAQLRDFVKVLAETGGAQLTDQAIAAHAKDRTKTESVKLNTPVPVELRYETLVVEDGKLYIYRDVYDLNTNTEENLRAVLAAYGVTLAQLSEDERARVMTALKEMSRDAAGRIDNAENGAGKPSATTPDAAAKKLAEKSKAADDKKVTRTVKGAKEVVVEIAALRGKGYPAPVALNTGGAPTKPTAAARRKK